MIISEMGETGYRKGHPWYYLLGGKPAKLKEIQEEARVSGYRALWPTKLIRPTRCRSQSAHKLCANTVSK